MTIAHASGYIECNSVEEKGINRYLIFDSIDKNKELLKKYNDVFNGTRNKIKKISGDECDYERITWKLHLIQMMIYHWIKQLKFHNMVITKICFEEDSKLYPQVFLDYTLYELNV